MNVDLSDGDEWTAILRLVKTVGVVVGLMITSVFIVSLLNLPEEPGPDSMAVVAPAGVVLADDIPVGMAPHYEAAQLHYDVFQEIPCFCGCEEMLGHRHLADCFIRADGTGFEAHALGCGVCLGEAGQVSEMIETGVSDPAEIRAAVVARWGDPYFTDN